MTLEPPQVLHRRLLLAPALHPLPHPDGRHGSPHVVHQLLPARPAGHCHTVETGCPGNPGGDLPLADQRVRGAPPHRRLHGHLLLRPSLHHDSLHVLAQVLIGTDSAQLLTPRIFSHQFKKLPQGPLWPVQDGNRNSADEWDPHHLSASRRLPSRPPRPRPRPRPPRPTHSTSTLGRCHQPHPATSQHWSTGDARAQAGWDRGRSPRSRLLGLPGNPHQVHHHCYPISALHVAKSQLFAQLSLIEKRNFDDQTTAPRSLFGSRLLVRRWRPSHLHHLRHHP